MFWNFLPNGGEFCGNQVCEYVGIWMCGGKYFTSLCEGSMFFTMAGYFRTHALHLTGHPRRQTYSLSRLGRVVLALAHAHNGDFDSIRK
jgi:hypothetical protein